MLDFWATWCEGCKEEIPWLLIDRTGKIADVHPGIVDKTAFEREIQVLLKESR